MVSVTAPPKLGRATDHMVRFLAGEFGVPPSSITFVYGRMNANKQLRIEAPTQLPVVFQELAFFWAISNELGGYYSRPASASPERLPV